RSKRDWSSDVCSSDLDAKMPDLLILIGTLGGLFLFGPIGFIVGPIVCGLFLTVWDIYGATFREVLPARNKLPPAGPRCLCNGSRSEERRVGKEWRSEW